MRKFLINITIELLLCVALLFGAEILARRAPDAGMFDTKSFNAAFSVQCSKYDWQMMTVDTVHMTKSKNVIKLALESIGQVMVYNQESPCTIAIVVTAIGKNRISVEELDSVIIFPKKESIMADFRKYG